MRFLSISYIIFILFRVNFCASENSGKCTNTKTLQTILWYGTDSFSGQIQGCINDPEVTTLLLQTKTNVLQPFTFVNMRKLKTLSLNNLYLEELKPSFIVNSSNSLKNIYASENQIKVIQYGVFNRMNLVNLRLDSNRIRYIADGALTDMNTTTLYLLNNQLTDLNSSWFGNTFIEKIDLSYNQIKQLHKESLYGVKNLISINLNYNKISNIEDGSFSGQENLKELHLAGNELKKLDFLSGVSILKKIDVGFNKISYIDLGNSTKIAQILIYPNPWICECLNEFWRYAWENDVKYGISATSRFPIEIGKRPLCLTSMKECNYTYLDVITTRYMNQVNYRKFGRYDYDAYSET